MGLIVLSTSHRSHGGESFSREGIVLTKTNRSYGEDPGFMFVKQKKVFDRKSWRRRILRRMGKSGFQYC